MKDLNKVKGKLSVLGNQVSINILVAGITKLQMHQLVKELQMIRYDKGIKGAGGYKGKDHYHILNPNSTGKHDYYLDVFGNPVSKNSKASHIIP